MDVWRITVAALRRWYILLPLLGVTVALVLAAGRGGQPEYEVTGASMVVPGRIYDEVPNPYGGPSDATNAVAIVLNSPAARQQIADEGLIPTYEVSPESRSTIIRFQVRGESEQQAIETGTAVFRMAAVELQERQSAAGIRLAAQYSIDVLQQPSVSAAVTDGKLRNMAIVGVLGAGLSLVVAVFFDDVIGLLRLRRRRKQEKGTSEGDHSDPARLNDPDSDSGRETETLPEHGTRPGAEDQAPTLSEQGMISRRR
ncbi:MAG: hypothetical protein ACI379_12270 [Nocardioides sp.]|uniref:hypothetical protein n=1 Tax=Nocardioides sp. TaxID=35761 RepID=UPI003F0B9D8B